MKLPEEEDELILEPEDTETALESTEDAELDLDVAEETTLEGVEPPEDGRMVQDR